MKKLYNDGLNVRFRNGWRVARKAAHILRTKYNAEEVRVAGSLLERDRFHEESDVDLVVPDFSMDKAFDCGKEMERFHPWRVDVIPLRSMPPKKARYFLGKSRRLEP